MLTVIKQHTGTEANAVDIDALLSKGLVGMREASRIYLPGKLVGVQ